VRALPAFSQYVLQHRLVQSELSHQLLQPAVFFLQLFKLAYLIHFRFLYCFFQR